jgi:hypothetical protein
LSNSVNPCAGRLAARILPSDIHYASDDVKKLFSIRLLMWVLLSGVFVLAGCGAPAAKDFGGPWKPVNRFPASTTAIPLNQEYEYFASPMDGTLKNMLTRWAKDSGLTLSYQLANDYTLTMQTSQIRTLDIHVAVGQLNAIYAPQGISIVVTDQQIEVDAIQTSATSSSSSGNVTTGAIKPSASP